MEILSLIIIVVFMYIFIIFNNLTKLKNNVKEAFAIMDVYLKKRFDLIPNLVSIVEGYAEYEKSTFEDIIQLRNIDYNTLKDSNKLDIDKTITYNITKIIALSEKYPDLKAHKNFEDLSKELVIVENEIAKSRKYYNAVVRDYNNSVEVFPNNIFAKIFNFKTLEMFEAQANEREIVKVEITNEDNK